MEWMELTREIIQGLMLFACMKSGLLGLGRARGILLPALRGLECHTLISMFNPVLLYLYNMYDGKAYDISRVVRTRSCKRDVGKGCLDL